jgi:DNA primase
MTIEQQNLSVTQVLQHYELKSRNGMANCAFHDDKTPSM